MMTKEEIIERLNALTDDDPEAAHNEADRLLIHALILAGMADVAEAYMDARDRVGFWYA
jgi:hypothetical protein